MSESFTTQGKDYLSTHHSSATAASSTSLADPANAGVVNTTTGTGSAAAAPDGRSGSSGSGGPSGTAARPATASPQFLSAVQGMAFEFGEAERAVARPHLEDVNNSGCCPVGSRTADCDKEAAAGIVSAASAAASGGPSDGGVTISTSSVCEGGLMLGAPSALTGDSKSVAAGAIPSASSVVADMQSLVRRSAASRISSSRPLGSPEDGLTAASMARDSASVASSSRGRGMKRRGSDSSVMLMAVDETTQCARKIYRSETTHSVTGGEHAASPSSPSAVPTAASVSNKRRRNYAPAAASSAAGGAVGASSRRRSRAATGGIYRSRASARMSSAVSSSTSHLARTGDRGAMVACESSRGACSAIMPPSTSRTAGGATVQGLASASASAATAGAGNGGSDHVSSSTSSSRMFPVVSHGGVAVAQAVRQQGSRVAVSARHGSSGGTPSILVLNAATGATTASRSISARGNSGKNSDGGKSASTKDLCCANGGARNAACKPAPKRAILLTPDSPLFPSGLRLADRKLTYATSPAPEPYVRRQALAQTLAHVLPSVNRYTLRELKIQNILQNPRLRHEVLFEPKLEFRPNTSGNMADAKQVATQQYWAAIEKAMSGWDPKSPRDDEFSMSTEPVDLSMVPVLLTEIREILAEMSEDAPNMTMARYAVELRERLDDERVRQQIDNDVFDPEPVVEYLAMIMRKLARPEHFASIDKLIEYARSGRFARALRMSFDVLEVLKIDIANRSIEMYREYMRSTAVAYERSHFCNMMRRNSVPVDETRVWWRMEYDALRGRFQSLDEIFSHVFRALVLGGDQPVPKLMHMDEARINGIRREYERLETVGFLFMGFTQFIQAIGRASASATGEPSDQQPEFRTENGRVDFERLGKECLKLVPEGYAINWSDSIGDSAAGDWRMPVGARGEVLVGVLVTQMVGLAGRVLGRKIQPTEVTQLWRAVRTVVQSGSPVRGIVAGRIKTTVEIHLSSLEASSTRFRGDAWEAMPEDAKLTLRRSMLGFLESVLASLAIKVHAIRAHHWLVYKSFYQALVSSSSLLSQPTVSIDKTPSESPASAVAAQPQAL